MILITQLPGFASPLYWPISPIFTAFVTAGPLTCVMSMKRGILSTAILPLLWFAVYRCIGELSMPFMWIWIFAVIIIGEIVRAIIGYDKLLSIRVCVPIISLVPLGNIFPLFFQKSEFLTKAAEEMDAEYIAGLDKYGTVWMFVIVVVLALVLAVISERISEKILKIRE